MRNGLRSFSSSRATVLSAEALPTRWFAPLSLAAGVLLLTPLALDAQGRSRGVPPGHLPPPGECRVWYDGRPPGQQPSPTSCDVARRDAYRNGGRVIYGGERRDGRGRDGRDRDGRDRDDDRRDDERYERRDRNDDRRDCNEKDRRKGDCEYDRSRTPDADRYPERYPDGRYPDDRYPDDRSPERTGRSLPEMIWAVVYGRGDRMREVQNWVGPNEVRARYSDRDRNGRPEQVTWTDGAGRVVQRWLDDSGDGRADRVELYRDGKLLRTLRAPSSR